MKSVEAIPPSNIRQKYVVDSMFGSLARKLRILGFDSYYASNLRDDDAIQIGLDQNRTIITADRELFSRTVNKMVRAVLLSSSDDLHNAATILKYHHKEIKFDPSSARCSSTRCACRPPPCSDRSTAAGAWPWACSATNGAAATPPG